MNTSCINGLDRSVDVLEYTMVPLHHADSKFCLEARAGDRSHSRSLSKEYLILRVQRSSSSS